jgi:hypothetical protein
MQGQDRQKVTGGVGPIASPVTADGFAVRAEIRFLYLETWFLTQAPILMIQGAPVGHRVCGKILVLSRREGKMREPSRDVIVLAVLKLYLAPATVVASEPVHWGDLSPDFAACSAGTEQSPVDIPATALVNPPGIRFNYQPSALNIVNNGHTIQVNYDGGPLRRFGERVYVLGYCEAAMMPTAMGRS